MDRIEIKKVTKDKKTLEDYFRLYSILKTVLPEYSRRIEKLEYLNSRNLSSHVLSLNGHVVGGYILHDEGDIAYLEFIALIESSQSKGLGKLLINNLMEEVSKLGFSEVRAETKSENLPIFKKLNFKEYFPGDEGFVSIYLNV